MGGNCQVPIITEAKRNVIMAQEESYKDLLSKLLPKQKTVLQAIAKKGVAHNVTFSKFIKKYTLNSASSVQAAIKLLLKNEFVTQDDGGYRIYDYFFSEWFNNTYYSPPTFNTIIKKLLVFTYSHENFVSLH